MSTQAPGTIGVQRLNGRWRLALDPHNHGRRDGWFGHPPQDEVREAPVPGTIQQAFPGRHGVAWYWRSFVPTHMPQAGERALLRFHAVDYLAEVWLNGQALGGHEGGETPFDLDATVALRAGENLVAVRVLNPTTTPIDGIVLDQTPHRNKYMDEDFRVGSGKNYGGIVQSVELLVVPAVRLAEVLARPDPGSGQIAVTITLRNDSGTGAEVAMRVAAGPALAGTVLAAAQLRTEAPAGESHQQATLQIPDHRLWSLDEPYLYRVAVTLEAQGPGGETYHHESAVRCGFRDFRVVDGFFQLNGTRLWVRSTHTGNHYPIGYYEPADPDLLRRDLLYAKAVGLNMVRFIAGMALPEQLDVCDELGLLVYEENLAAWLLGDSPQMAERFERSLREMILRDRQHPSVVIWGLLNETRDGPVFRQAAGSLAVIRDLDPARLVLLSSGRWDADLTIGSVCNPGSTAWEPVWGHEGAAPPRKSADGEQSHREPAYIPGAGDVHIYPQLPQSDETNAFLRTLGHDSKPVFVSEYGIGSLLDVVHILGRYAQARQTPAADDVVVFQTMRDHLEADWVRFGLEQVYPFPRDLLRESQRLHSRQRLRGLNLLRANPQIAGYNVTGMLDHGYTGEGIWTFWREWKPGVVEAFEDGFAPLRWCLFVTPGHTYAGGRVTVEAVLAHEDVLRPGTYPARLRLFGPAGTVWEQGVTARLPVAPAGRHGPLAVPVFAGEVELHGPAGTYVFAADMEQGGSPAGDRLTFYVSERTAPPAAQGDAALWGIGGQTASWLQAHGLLCRPWAAQDSGNNGVILIGDPSADGTTAAWQALAEQIARGSTAVFLSPLAFRRGDDPVGWLPLATKGRCYQFNNWLYHREDVAKPHPLFAGLPAPGILDWDYYGPVIPRYVFEGQEVPADIAAVYLATGYTPHPLKTGYASGLIAAVHPFGAGRFVLNSLRILENLDRHPAADCLLLNMVAYAQSLTERTPAPLPADFGALLGAIGYRP
jgi:hypothetical protein